jgi:hypothetical protein
MSKPAVARFPGSCRGIAGRAGGIGRRPCRYVVLGDERRPRGFRENRNVVSRRQTEAEGAGKIAAVVTVVLAGVGRSISGIGAVLNVGANIAGNTRISVPRSQLLN